MNTRIAEEPTATCQGTPWRWKQYFTL